MEALDLWTKRNIRDYLNKPESKFYKDYPKERQEIRKAIRKEYEKTKKMGGVIEG